jgi:hypothetical protein
MKMDYFQPSVNSIDIESSSNLLSYISCLDSIINLSTTTRNKKPRHKKFCHTFDVTSFTQQPPKFAGKNTLFSRHRASFFLLHFDYKKHFRVISNDRKFKQFSFYLDRSHPSFKFVISSFINGVFHFLNLHSNVSETERQKFFNIVRRHMIEQYRAIRCRLNNAEKVKNNNQTRTFFRFSVYNHTYFFGFYLPCVSDLCCAPPTFVTKHGVRCWIHWKKFCQEITPNPPPHQHEMSNVLKSITSLRLGISYTKEISFSERSNKYYVVYKNFERLPTISKQQANRFDRLTRSPQSNDFKKLITADKSHAAQSCKYQPLSRRRQTIRDVTSPSSPPCEPPSVPLINSASPNESGHMAQKEAESMSHTIRSVFWPNSLTRDPDPQLRQQHPIVSRHVEPASSAADLDPIVESLPVPEGFVRHHRAPK